MLVKEILEVPFTVEIIWIIGKVLPQILFILTIDKVYGICLLYI